MTGSSPSTSLAPPTPPVRTVTRPLIETDPRPETGRALMLATMYQGEDSHAPTRREYFPPPHPPPARRLSRSYRTEHSGRLSLFSHPYPHRPGTLYPTAPHPPQHRPHTTP